MLKIILDTNVLINAMNDNLSYTWKIINLVLKGEIEAYASEKIIKEYNLIVERNIVKKQDREQLENFIQQVNLIPVYQKIMAIADDPEDNKFIECAVEAKADYIISSDRHLLRLGNYDNIKIKEPKDFWYLYQGQKPEADEEWKDFFRNILGINK
ncbi:MAG TPA: putative toxin-antitoxin system toxin component, PIN family [bacterium]|nr:putative toxin-antitoxin system toxin component, PIN family [bacterium]HPL95577.1 putative toxin-antitoxin system toxin component, PIN family [bacterium]